MSRVIDQLQRQLEKNTRLRSIMMMKCLNKLKILDTRLTRNGQEKIGRGFVSREDAKAQSV